MPQRRRQKTSGYRVSGPRPGDAPDLTLASARRQALATFERLYVLSQLRRHGGSVARAARRAGISATTLRALIERHDVDRREYLPHPRPVLVVSRKLQDDT